MNLKTSLEPQYLWFETLCASGAAFVCTVFSRAYLALRRPSNRASRVELANSVEELTSRLDETNSELEKLFRRVSEIEQRYTVAPEFLSELASVNLNRRGQVIQLHRRGQALSAIASTLRLSQGEVRLIIKVHELTRSELSEESGRGFPLKSAKILR
jgi:response regulator RpfG family c-di-GMP phosphodiesterase